MKHKHVTFIVYFAIKTSFGQLVVKLKEAVLFYRFCWLSTISGEQIVGQSAEIIYVCVHKSGSILYRISKDFCDTDSNSIVGGNTIAVHSS